jgi:hypothetical protein
MSNFLNKIMDDGPTIDSRYLCPICNDEDEKMMTTLKCGHKFCRKCIVKWFLKLHTLIYSSSNYITPRECPVCRQNGGHLKLLANEKYLQDIHELPPNSDQKKLSKCGASIKSKPGKKCENIGNLCYGGYCGKHKRLYFKILS